MGLGSFISNAVKSVGHVVESVVDPIAHVVSHTAEDVAHAVEHTASSVARTVGGAAQAIGRPVGKAIGTVSGAVGKVGIGKVTIGAGASFVTHTIQESIHKIEKIPVLGPVFGISMNLHLINGIIEVGKGQRIDNAAMTALKNQIKDYKAVAPYAASVVSFIPGIGQGVGAGIMAGSALAEGQPLTQVVLEAIKGAIPGGPVAQMAFNAAQAAAKGEPFDQIAIDSLPVSDQVKQAIKTGLALSKDIANGKPVDKALLARVDDTIKLVSPEITKALTIGTAVGIAQKVQDEVGKQISSPQAKAVLGEIGSKITSVDPLIQAAKGISNLPQFHQGFDVAVGLLHGKKIDQNLVTGLRNSLSGEQRKGFDTAAALHIGRKIERPIVIKKLGKRTKSKTGAKATPTQAAAYYVTHGLVGAAEHQKVGIVSDLAVIPEAKVGATDAIKEIAESRKDDGLWAAIMRFFGLSD